MVEGTLAGREVPLRVKDNLIATVCGLLHFEGYAESLGVPLPELDVAALVAPSATTCLRAAAAW